VALAFSFFDHNRAGPGRQYRETGTLNAKTINWDSMQLT